MPARYGEAQERETGFIIANKMRQYMSLHVVYLYQRLAQSQRE